jgi:hypothetical protein
MVMRGSNEKRKELKGTKWQSISCDEGRTWSAAQPWRYDDGSEVTSPSSICQLLAHSNGKNYWIGNLCDQPYANGPRYPLFIGEVDAGGQLQRATLCQIDGLSEGEDASLCLSNFCAHEDRGSGDIVMHMTRTFATGGVMSGDSYRYTIGVD